MHECNEWSDAVLAVDGRQGHKTAELHACVHAMIAVMQLLVVSGR